MSTKNKQIVEKINDSFAKGNTEGFLENCADNVVWRMIGDKTFTGKNAIREFMASMEGTEPPKFTVDNTIAEGDSVVSYGDMTMTEKGKPRHIHIVTYIASRAIRSSSLLHM